MGIPAALSVCIAMALPAMRLAAQPFRISADRPATIEGAGVHPLARIAAQRLQAYIERVTGARPDSGRPAAVHIMLETRAIPYFRPDGFLIRTVRRGGREVVAITAPSAAGLKYGCYRLIREMRQHGKELLVPALSISANPWLKTRELFVAEVEWHPTPGEKASQDDMRRKFDWQNWPVSKIEQYVDLLDAMGYNSVQCGDGEAWIRYSGRFITRAEMTRKTQAMYRRARGNGMGTSFFLWAQEGARDAGFSRLSPRAPDEFADMHANWDLAIRNHGPYVDRWILHWADPGGCKTRDCTIHTPQEATNQFFDLLRGLGFRAEVSFSLWALRWGAWPGFESDLRSVVNSGVLRPEIGINLMRAYTAETARAIKAQHRITGVWGWYLNDLETNPALHAHTGILDNEFQRIDVSAAATLDWYSLEDNDHILNLPSLYAGAQKLWDTGKPARESLAEFCDAVWGREAAKVRDALEAIAEVRCGPGQPMLRANLWPHGYMCRLGRGSTSPAQDLELCERALRGLDSFALDREHVPKLPIPVEPSELLEQIRLHLARVRDFAKVRVAYDEALRPSVENRAFEDTVRKMAELPDFPDVIAGTYGAGLETFHHGLLLRLADAWKSRSFRDNLALGRPVTASTWRGTDPRFAPGNAVNGLLCDYREEGWAAGAYGPAWMKIDLGSLRPVRSVRIYNRGYRRDVWDNNLAATPQKAEVTYAAEDSDPAYRPLGGFEGWQPTDDAAAFRQVQAAAPVSARWLKIVLHPAANGEPAGCGEVEVR